MALISTKDFVATLTEEEKQRYLEELTDERWAKLIKESRDYARKKNDETTLPG